MEFEAKMVGLKHADRALTLLGPFALQELRGAMRLAGNIVRKRARENLSRLDATDARPKNRQPGELSDSMSVKVWVDRTNKEVVARVGAYRFWAIFIEWGTSNMTPRPFMRAALDASRQDVMNRIGSHLRKRFKRYRARYRV